MKLTGFPKALLIIFVLTLPLVNPLVRGDGVAYYAYVRSILVQHNLRFENDWINSPWPYVDRTVDAEGRIPTEYTKTGHLPNRYSVGPSMLWAPFLIPVHLTMVELGKAGVNVLRDGFSKTYLVAAALATALYGFLGLWASFIIARRYVAERWAFMATLGMWFASSLPVYMYFDPFYSHAHSVFVVGIFLWYWRRTRARRSVAQWAILGLLAGLMLNVYYINITLLLLPLVESAKQYAQAWRAPQRESGVFARLLVANLIFSVVTLVAFLPTLITRQIIYGSPFNLGYEPSSWTHPAIWQPLLSSNHGLLPWTPIVLPGPGGHVSSPPLRPGTGRIITRGIRGHVLCRGLSSRLAWHVILWKPLLHFTHPAVYRGAGGFHPGNQPVVQPLAGCHRRRRACHQPADRLEPGVHFSVGYWPGSARGANLLETDGLQSSNGGACPGRQCPENLFHPSHRNDEAHRTGRFGPRA